MLEKDRFGKIAYSPQKAQIRHPPKAKVKLWIVIFFFCKNTIDKTLYSIDNTSTFHILLLSVVAVVAQVSDNSNYREK